MKNSKITFLGAAQTVTGSATLIEYHNQKILVDCGMFQGPKEIRKKNWEVITKQLARSVNTILLTHAHIDHSGLIPKIFQLGFRGKIYSTEGTYQLAKILLPDSAYLQEEEARRIHNKQSEDYRGTLYSIEDANESLKSFHVVKRNQWFELDQGVSFQFLRAGHILGSSIVQVSLSHENGVRILSFSGDLGNNRQRMIKGPEDISETDDLIIESTYGDRIQPKTFPEDQIKQHILKIVKTKGALLIPAFAVGRTQEILFMIKNLEERNEIPHLPVFLDSPMALEATSLYLEDSEDIKLNLKEGELVKPLSPENFHKVRKAEDSIQLTKKTGPLIIISAAGMLTGGRILYHLKERLPDPDSIILFVGYQAEETKGRLLQNGMSNIRIHKENISVKAQIETIDSLSAHADSDDLVNWVSRINKKPKRVFINHGERTASNSLAYRLRHELGLTVIVPNEAESFSLDTND